MEIFLLYLRFSIQVAVFSTINIDSETNWRPIGAKLQIEEKRFLKKLEFEIPSLVR